MKRKVRKNIFNLKWFLKPSYTLPFLVTLFVFLCIKQFLFDVLIVQSPAMYPTLRQGEMVFVAKFFTPEKNDVVGIQLPLSIIDTDVVKSIIFKRIVGLPGDKVEIRNAKVLVNGVLLPENESFLHNYIAKIKTQADTTAFVRSGINEKFLIDDSCVYLVSLTENKFFDLKDQLAFSSLVSNSEDSADFDVNVFPYNNEYKWNEDYFGPLYIPKKGDTLKLDSGSVKIYKRIISDYEGNKLEVKNGEILINEIETNFYITKKNYYFVVGDNFDNSIDSRNWGFIPERKIKCRIINK
jgi:signal peptidase I